MTEAIQATAYRTLGALWDSNSANSLIHETSGEFNGLLNQLQFHVKKYVKKKMEIYGSVQGA